jgi:hypothetical protein
MRGQLSAALCAHGRRRRDICDGEANERQAAQHRRRAAVHPDRAADEYLLSPAPSLTSSRTNGSFTPSHNAAVQLARRRQS